MTASAGDADNLETDNAIAKTAVITVTYNPNLKILDKQLSQLPSTALKVVVDNASGYQLRSQLQQVTEKHAAVLLENDANLGLPAALNQGARQAQKLRPGCRFLLLLDQDTEPGVDNVERLLASYNQIAATQGKACCIGPRLVDVSTGIDHGFHQIRYGCWTRLFSEPHSQTPVPVANLNGSGTLIPISIFNELGGLEEDLFIDLVDMEWSFRVLAAGYKLYGIPNISFSHRMGERSLRFWWFGWRVWPQRSPLRHYYLFRNAMWLMRRSYVRRVWKIWAAVKLGLTFIVYAIFSPERGAQLNNMVKGLREGARVARSKNS